MASHEERERAWQIHHERGHPAGYDGPCWGPTVFDLEEAKEQLAGELAGEHADENRTINAVRMAGRVS